MTKRHLVWLVVLAGAVLGTGCMRPPPGRIGFNEKIAKAVRKLGNQGQALQKALEPLKKGDTVSSISGTVSAIDKILFDIDVDFEDQLLPSKPSSSAPEFKAAFEEFLNVEKSIVKNNLKNIGTVLATPGVDNKEKWAQVEAELKAMNAAEAPALSRLKIAQRKYAEEHNFKLVMEHAN